VQEDGTLLISNAQVTDNGEYTCIAENELGMGDDFMSLEVGMPPQMVHIPKGTYMSDIKIPDLILNGDFLIISHENNNFLWNVITVLHLVSMQTLGES
jgi:hypothetical protein